MFSQVCVCPRGVCVYPSMHWAGGSSQGVFAQRGCLPGGVCPLGGQRPRPEANTPHPDTMGYGQQAGGTYPTGMHYCY